MSPQPAPAAPRPPLRVALAGIGVVGGGVVRLLEANRDLIARRAGRAVEIVAISARDRQKDRGVDLSPYRWEDDMAALVEADDVDVVVEMVGGADGPALTLARQALGAGKALVTANKAMIAHHGLDLARIAEAQDRPLKYEAAVAGGIPVIKAIREGASANEIARVYGILNGTCNYILTLMEREGASFADALAAAQAEGYAEADPTFDVDGIDAAHKLSILAALCFGTRLDFDTVTAEGIRGLIAADIREAAALGHRVRLIGMAERDESGLYQHVQPCLVPADHPLAYVPGALNAVVAEGNFVGRLFFEGAGAGAGPTASAIVADIIDIARDEYGPAFAMPVDALDAAPAADARARVGKHYVRLIVEDRIGVLAEIATAMRDAGVSIESFIQRGDDAEGGVLIALVTHEGPGRAVAAALAALAASDHVIGTPMHMPILAL
ncbi:homoserine dehydrogenase [Sphingopyxis terrae]|uniref:Homoserine dehydrogenase n=1 Tax=Sphingopyxis terrae subsp. ummariensis TaxID=429001 RepID=A0A1Y6FUM2_9SPHN|nr:homoserine dehydrogenase [Sphingopyxis terrae]PCF90232.1 homoserine dehydrogenase [Sphingopyxis terrae subsp. ummariensis]SMQ79325.1 homoserine dehydrogenase [Sphingopyxis terrae subsp. ummariensis]